MKVSKLTPELVDSLLIPMRGSDAGIGEPEAPRKLAGGVSHRNVKGGNSAPAGVAEVRREGLWTTLSAVPPGRA